MYFAAGNRLIPVPGRVGSSLDRKGSRSGLCFSIRRSTGKKIIKNRIITDKMCCVSLKKNACREHFTVGLFKHVSLKYVAVVSKISELNIDKKMVLLISKLGHQKNVKKFTSCAMSHN
jgi:hypothetical protein